MVRGNGSTAATLKEIFEIIKIDEIPERLIIGDNIYLTLKWKDGIITGAYSDEVKKVKNPPESKNNKNSFEIGDKVKIKWHKPEKDIYTVSRVDGISRLLWVEEIYGGYHFDKVEKVKIKKIPLKKLRGQIIRKLENKIEELTNEALEFEAATYDAETASREELEAISEEFLED